MKYEPDPDSVSLNHVPRMREYGFLFIWGAVFLFCWLCFAFGMEIWYTYNNKTMADL